MLGVKLILGFGITGISCARYFSKKNIKFKIFDTRHKSDIKSSFISDFDQDLLFFNIYNNELFTEVDEIIISPGFNQNHPILDEVNNRKLPLSTDIDIFKKFSTKPIISITGTNGKTTVVSMLEHVLTTLGIKAIACGNNGIPPLDINPNEYDYIILELSSYQLEYMSNHDSYISLITNIDHDHLERHNTINDYSKIKLKVFSSCENPIANLSLTDDLIGRNSNLIRYGLTNGKPMLCGSTMNNISINQKSLHYENISIGFLAGIKAFTAAVLGGIGSIPGAMLGGLLIGLIEVFWSGYISIEYKGRHNLENILGICSITSLLNISLFDCIDALKNFIHLPHRIELVKNTNNVNWYNDSKSTNTASTKAALEFIDKNIILILGGAQKNMDYKILSNLINEKVKLVIFFGENKNYIKKQLDIKTDVVDVETITEAVITSNNHATNNDSILFSPASPSFDMFKNFEDRGEAFKDAINNNVK